VEINGKIQINWVEMPSIEENKRLSGLFHPKMKISVINYY